jgi:hypothetical protein
MPPGGPRLAGRLSAVALLALAAAGCRGGPDTEAQLRARQQALDPLQLWLVEAMDGAGRVQGRAYVCTDAAVRETFLRARAEINGEPCLDDAGPVVKPGLWTIRCRAQGRRFAVSAVTRGDPQRDFRFDFALTPLDHATDGARQTRRFRKVGACPAGWNIGDQAPPGGRPRA